MAAITDRTRKMLWGRSGGVCAMCKKQLFEDEGLSEDPSVLGQECHIVGEENTAKSPRGLNSMPLDQRNLFDNLILLCRDHHKIIDDQPEKYTIDELHRIKNDHIVWVRNTLGFDEAKQRDDETYLAIAQKWSELAGLDDWDNFTFLVIAGDSPTVKAERLKQLDELQDWLFRLVYPNRYVEIDNAFENFRRVLNDFRSVFSQHMDPPKVGYKYVHTCKYYKIDHWDEKLYGELLKNYREHSYLLSDFAVELTRAANYICDLIRKHVYRDFRVKEGLLIAQTGTWMDGLDHAIRVAYKPEERVDFPYPGFEEFMTVRCQRDFYYGPPKN